MNATDLNAADSSSSDDDFLNLKLQEGIIIIIAMVVGILGLLTTLISVSIIIIIRTGLQLKGCNHT